MLVALAALTVLLVACGGGGGDNTDDQKKALEQALIFAGDDPSALPAIGQTYDCTINIGHQPPTPQKTFAPVRGQCLWTVAAQGKSWLVTFKETWFCSDWSANTPNYPACDSIAGSHTWEYFVDLVAKTVDKLSDRGQFAPDM